MLFVLVIGTYFELGSKIHPKKFFDWLLYYVVYDVYCLDQFNLKMNINDWMIIEKTLLFIKIQ